MAAYNFNGYGVVAAAMDAVWDGSPVSAVIAYCFHYTLLRFPFNPVLQLSPMNTSSLKHSPSGLPSFEHPLQYRAYCFVFPRMGTLCSSVPHTLHFISDSPSFPFFLSCFFPPVFRGGKRREHKKKNSSLLGMRMIKSLANLNSITRSI